MTARILLGGDLEGTWSRDPRQVSVPPVGGTEEEEEREPRRTAPPAPSPDSKQRISRRPAAMHVVERSSSGGSGLPRCVAVGNRPSRPFSPRGCLTCFRTNNALPDPLRSSASPGSTEPAAAEGPGSSSSDRRPAAAAAAEGGSPATPASSSADLAPGTASPSASDVYLDRIWALTKTVQAVESRASLLESRCEDLDLDNQSLRLHLREAAREVERMRGACRTATDRSARLEQALSAREDQLRSAESAYARLLQEAQESARQARRDRDDALVELAGVYEDVEALQSALIDSATLIKFLRQRVVELELNQRVRRGRGG